MVTIAGSHNITTSATSQVLMENRNGKRVSFSISNYGGTPAWINISNEQGAAVGYGIYLAPGATVSDSDNADYRCAQFTISAVDDGAGGATTLSFWERVRAD